MATRPTDNTSGTGRPSDGTASSSRVPASVPQYVRRRPFIPPPRRPEEPRSGYRTPRPTIAVGAIVVVVASLGLLAVVAAANAARSPASAAGARARGSTESRVAAGESGSGAASGDTGSRFVARVVATPAPWGSSDSGTTDDGDAGVEDAAGDADSSSGSDARGVAAPLAALAAILVPDPDPTETPAPLHTATITLTPEPTLTPTPAVEASLPIVPVIDGAMKDRLRGVHQVGLDQGRRPEVFMKVGDSITVSGYFMTDIGCGSYDLGPFGHLADTIAYFGATGLPTDGSVARCGSGNSFTRASRSAGRGWVASQVLTEPKSPKPDCPPPNDTPLKCEISLIQPGSAVVMLGTNDLHNLIDLRWYDAALDGIVRELLASGVVPILSNIPHRTDRQWAAAEVGTYNAVVRDVAGRHQVPLLNYWRALQGPEMARAGMEPDGIHPNAHGYGASFSERGQLYGYNQRNLTALQTLDKVRRIVFQDGQPE